MKKKWMVFVVLAMAGLLLFLLLGCAKENTDKTGGSIGDPADYFPTNIGREWTYKITIGEAEPIYYEEVMWPLGENKVASYSTVGRFLALLKENAPKEFLLKIKVKKAAAKQGILEYPDGVELEILQDELGIFEWSEEVFWAIGKSQRFMVQQVVTRSPDSPGAPTGSWGSWGQENGSSMRLLLFGGNPSTSIGLKDSPDTLYFDGIETDVPGYKGTPTLHFRRTVTLSKDEKSGDTFSKDFTEDTWFVKGIGLAWLIQKVEGKTSMTMTLK